MIISIKILALFLMIFTVSCNYIKSLNSSFDIIKDDYTSVPDTPPTKIQNGKTFPKDFTIQDNVYCESQDDWNYTVKLYTERGELKDKDLNLEIYSKLTEYTSGIKKPKNILSAISIRDPNAITGQLQLDINSSVFDTLGSKGQRAKIKVDIYINAKGYNTGVRTVYLDIKRTF